MMTQLMLLEEAHRWRSRKGGRGVRSTLKQKLGWQSPPHFGDNTCNIGHFSAHIFCPQTTQEQPKKHHETGPPEQLLASLQSCPLPLSL